MCEEHSTSKGWKFLVCRIGGRGFGSRDRAKIRSLLGRKGHGRLNWGGAALNNFTPGIS
jgi:hypothetical protein